MDGERLRRKSSGTAEKARRAVAGSGTGTISMPALMTAES